jgi:CDP-6-deoxy-D-xylo-4-hexulose-3-dehydrase
MPLLQLNLNPIPIDVSLNNLNISSEELEKKLDGMKGLFVTNLLGFCGDLDKIKKICEEKNIILIEDNCESLDSVFKGKKLGNYSLASTFSFFVGHHLSTIEGGMVCTDDEELYEMLKMVRSHGWGRDLKEKTQEKLNDKYGIDEFYSRYAFYVSAYNLRPTEINGFIGVEQLKYIEELNKIRNKNFLEFNNVVKINSDFQELNLDHMDFVSNFAFPLICKDKETFERYKKKFQENDVEIRPIVGGSIVEQPFFKEVGEFKCPNAKKIHELGFYFPNNPELTEEEIGIIKSLLK